jgi:acyl carrier protein
VNTTTFDQIRQIAADVFDEPIGKIQLQSSPQTLQNWDSLAHLNLILALEESFQCEITPEESELMTTIATVVAIVERRIGAAS